ncbi:phage tail spike protein [Rossellomorea marisflavi]
MGTLAILENAYDQEVEREVNQLWYFSFSLPINDPKNEHCKHFNLVSVSGKSGRDYGLYRIMPTQTKKHGHYIRYECEHVLSTLMDTVMEGFTNYTNLTTRTVLENLLNQQDERLWVLGDCDFSRRFSYGFENENGLLAPVLSVPKPFSEPYEFQFDTTKFPWVLHLKKSTMDIRSEYRWTKDILEFEEYVDPTEIVNYIIPKGAGEGVNQLDIRKVNGGRKYLKDDESIAKWGKKPWIWIDRRFKDAQSLKESGEANLKDMKDPKVSITVKAADLSILPQYSHERRFLNTMSRIIVEKDIYEVRIIREKISDLSREYDVEYTLGTKLGSVAESTAEYERKIKINEAYSQGATNIDTYSYNDNADKDNPAVIRFYLPDELVNINKLELTYEVDNFRAYSQATKGGGAIVKSTKGGGGTTATSTSGGGTTATSSSGGGTTATSTSGGGVSKSTNSGGGTTQSSSAGGDHTHLMFDYVGDGGGGLGYPEREFVPQGGYNFRVAIKSAAPASLTTAGGSGNHSHSVTVPSHSHDFNTPNHSHDVTVPNHTHNVTIPNHSHNVTIPDHTHEIELPNHTHEILYGIYKYPSRPSSVTVKVDGNPVSGTAKKIDLIPHLSKGDDGRILRGQFHEVEITPNDLGRINANIYGQYFLQSQGGDVY